MAVLWVLVSVAILCVGLAMTARSALGTAQNRVNLLRGAWHAEGCAERARAAIDETLGAGSQGVPYTPSPSRAWDALDRTVAASSLPPECDVSLTPSGTRLAVSDSTATEVWLLLRESGLASESADSLVDALLDWIDDDDVPRPLGAERAWYTALGRPGPRNGPLGSDDELLDVRGFARSGALDSLLGSEHDRLLLSRAPLAVLSVLPGFGPEAIARLSELRQAHVPAPELAAFAAMLSPAARTLILSNYALLAQRTTSTPETWTLRSRASVGTPAVTTTLELRLVNAGARAAVVRRRSWP